MAEMIYSNKIRKKRKENIQKEVLVTDKNVDIHQNSIKGLFSSKSE